MTPKQKLQRVEELVTWMVSNGYKEQHDNRMSGKHRVFKKTSDKGVEYRFLITSVMLRKERKASWEGYDGKKESRWFRVYSGYIKDIFITENNKLGGKISR